MVPVTSEVTEFFNKSIVGKGMPEMRNYSLFIFLIYKFKVFQL